MDNEVACFQRHSSERHAAFLNHGIIKNEVSLHIVICGILTYDAEEGFHRAIKKPAPVYLGACKETIELVLDSFD